jgi:hypothetical protein
MNMKAFLVRVGIDSTQYSGGFNAPIDLETLEFAYVPIRERKEMLPTYKRTFHKFKEPCNKLRIDLPDRLLEKDVYTHIDPDFSNLTYGDEDKLDIKGNHRGRPLRNLKENDWLVFYAGLKPIKSDRCYPNGIIDAIIGVYVVKEFIQASELARRGMRDSNAHTRYEFTDADIVVIAKPGVSGRLDKCIPIGCFRDKAHRVYSKLINEWGILSVNDGYIQRSAILPEFKEPEKFKKWFENQLTIRKLHLIQRNN